MRSTGLAPGVERSPGAPQTHLNIRESIKNDTRFILANLQISATTAHMESTKKKVGLFLPTELADALDELASRVGKKQKWLIVGAALVRLLQASETQQNDLIRAVKIADLPGGSFAGLIAQARAKGAGEAGPGFDNLVAEAEGDVISRPARSHAPAGTSAGTRTPRPAPRPATGRKRG